jgi:hypothetical protein
LRRFLPLHGACSEIAGQGPVNLRNLRTYPAMSLVWPTDSTQKMSRVGRFDFRHASVPLAVNHAEFTPTPAAVASQRFFTARGARGKETLSMRHRRRRSSGSPNGRRYATATRRTRSVGQAANRCLVSLLTSRWRVSLNGPGLASVGLPFEPSRPHAIIPAWHPTASSGPEVRSPRRWLSANCTPIDRRSGRPEQHVCRGAD